MRISLGIALVLIASSAHANDFTQRLKAAKTAFDAAKEPKVQPQAAKVEASKLEALKLAPPRLLGPRQAAAESTGIVGRLVMGAERSALRTGQLVALQSSRMAQRTARSVFTQTLGPSAGHAAGLAAGLPGATTAAVLEWSERTLVGPKVKPE
jgi:hypothetical protein